MDPIVVTITIVIISAIEAALWFLFHHRLHTLAPEEECCDTPLDRFIRARHMGLVAGAHGLLFMMMTAFLLSLW